LTGGCKTIVTGAASRYTCLVSIAPSEPIPPPLLKLADTRRLFAGADYRRLWAIGGLTGVARWLEFVAIAIFAYELTHSPALVALLAVLRMVPYVLLGFLVGADRKSVV